MLSLSLITSFSVFPQATPRERKQRFIAVMTRLFGEH